MENASKALIIAGAILLSIIIISLGLIVVNNVRESISGHDLSAEEKQAFNSKITGYEGMNVSGIQVNALIQQVIQLNTEAVRDNTGTFIGIVFPTASDLTGNTFMLINAYTGSASVKPDVSYSDLGSSVTAASVSMTNVTNTTTTKGASTKLKKVATGKTFKVETKLTDGIISHILVKAN